MVATTHSQQVEALEGPQGAGLCLALFASSENLMARKHLPTAKVPRYRLHKMVLRSAFSAASRISAAFHLPRRHAHKQHTGVIPHQQQTPKITKRYEDLPIGQHEVELDVRGNVSVSATYICSASRYSGNYSSMYIIIVHCLLLACFDMCQPPYFCSTTYTDSLPHYYT